MNEFLIFFPVLAHVFLVLVLFILLAVRKSKAVSAKAVDLKKTAMDNRQWTDEVVKVSNNIANQFETPILFYVLCVIAFATGIADTILLGLATGYVVLRYIHAYIHTGSNFVPYRMRTFALSLLVVLVMLVYITLLLSTNI